ncbi:MAG: penicillin-binding protein activator [Kangiellaceae bacterium]|nr:penicillin-binding protein activator [Kangiellaceae bacterium]
MTKMRINKNLLLGFSVLFLASCITTQPRTSPRQSESVYGNNSARSADYYLSEASKRDGSAQAPYKLQAAAAYASQQRFAEAYNVLRSFQPTQLPLSDRDAYYMLMGESALKQKKAFEAIRSLQAVSNPDSHSMRWNAHYQVLMADALAANNRLADAAVQRINADDLFESVAQVTQQHEKAWQELMQSPAGAIELKRERARTNKELGWLDMAIIQHRYARNPRSLSGAMKDWQELYVGHPAINYVNQQIQQLGEIDMIAPTKVALFVPLSGRLAAVGSVIRDGFLAAHYEKGNSSSETADIVVYDSAAGDSMDTLYRRAMDEGVDFVVGPLTKRNIDDIATYRNLPIPTLALNRLENAYGPSNFYQFGLPIEDEARQIAQYAMRKNQNRAFIINADNSVGERATKAFIEEFQSLGGSIVKIADMSNGQNPKSAIMGMLGADRSEKRTSELQNLLNVPIESSGQGSSNADFIFMVAKAKEARIIKPYLNYYYAYNLPVYATSTIYNGSSSRTRDNDLEGIMFTDAPWMIGSTSNIRATKSSFSKLIPNSTNAMARFFALGHDAYLLMPELSQLSAMSDYSIDGLSGILFMDRDGNIVRQLAWGQYNQGNIIPVN